MRRKANLARTVAVLVALVLVVGSDRAAAQEERPDPPQVRATAWALVDADTGLYLAGKNPDKRLPVASTTKIMVALLALEDRKSTRLNSSHANISYAVFCLKKKKKYK